MSDEVSDFLRSVELLKGRREEEDEARSRELEEKILQEKKERQARRAGTPIFSDLCLPSLRVIPSNRCACPPSVHRAEVPYVPCGTGSIGRSHNMYHVPTGIALRSASSMKEEKKNKQRQGAKVK